MRNILLKALGCINSILLFQLRIVKVNYRFKKLGRMVPDYVRFGALQLLFLEIKENQVEGCMAELGVYRGDFARHINRAFPDRILYLFDTFEGFDKKDLQYDKENDFSNLSEGCTNTSADYVLKRMSYPEKCRVVKGYFPDSLSALPEKDEIAFAFVSIDADLYQPIYEGLCYFYPRLADGGYIMVHDYNWITFKGVREAVKKFARENSISYVPIPDTAGSIVIIK